MAVVFVFRKIAFWICLIYFSCLNENLVVYAKGGGGGGRGGGGGGRGGGFGGGGKTSGGGRPSGGGSSFGGSGTGSRGGTAKGALAGFGAGYVTGSLSSSFRHGVTGSNSGYYYGGNYYYLGNRYYPGTGSGQIKCSIQTPSDFDVRYNDTGNRVTELIYQCASSQYCCEDGCCNNLSSGAIAGIIIGCLIGIPCLIWCIVKCVRESKKNKKSYQDIQGEGGKASDMPYYGTVPSQGSSPYYSTVPGYIPGQGSPAQQYKPPPQDYPPYPHQ